MTEEPKSQFAEDLPDDTRATVEHIHGYAIEVQFVVRNLRSGYTLLGVYLTRESAERAIEQFAARNGHREFEVKL